MGWPRCAAALRRSRRCCVSVRCDLSACLREMSSRQAADLLFVAGWPPMYGVFGQWVAHESEPLQCDNISAWLRGILSPAQWETFTTASDLDVALCLPAKGN